MYMYVCKFPRLSPLTISRVRKPHPQSTHSCPIRALEPRVPPAVLWCAVHQIHASEAITVHVIFKLAAFPLPVYILPPALPASYPPSTMYTTASPRTQMARAAPTTARPQDTEIRYQTMYSYISTPQGATLVRYTVRKSWQRTCGSREDHQLG